MISKYCGKGMKDRNRNNDKNRKTEKKGEKRYKNMVEKRK
jgi:hypothetical protein